MALTEGGFVERVQQLLKEEADKPRRWWYLSFADEKKFLGGFIVRARGITSARMAMVALGIKSPGGEVLSAPIDDDKVPESKYRYRLLTKEEIKEFWPDAKPLKEHEADERKKDEGHN
jgi:hypothetical protein